MEPDSATLLVVLLLGAVGSLYALARLRRVIIRVVAAVLAMALCMTAGMAVVNDYFGYYRTWSQLSADLSGNYASFTAPAAARPGFTRVHGQLESVMLPGARSGINRRGLVYLPPQYFQPAYRHTRFPAVELIHGSPGVPSSWVVHLSVVQVADQLLSQHLMGPVVLVMPDMNGGPHHLQEGVNAPGTLDDTYLTQDVRHDVVTKFRVSTSPAEWGIAGYSSGGYCAANLALRHPGAFGAAGLMDAYLRPSDGPAAAALHFDPSALAANDPLLRASRLGSDAAPLPAFWVSAGTGNRADIAAALAFTHALHGVEQVTLNREPGAGHNFFAWQPALPHLLAWLWQQLAPPALRVRFPIAGPVQNGVITVAPHPRASRPSAVRPSAVRPTPSTRSPASGR